MGYCKLQLCKAVKQGLIELRKKVERRRAVEWRVGRGRRRMDLRRMTWREYLTRCRNEHWPETNAGTKNPPHSESQKCDSLCHLGKVSTVDLGRLICTI